MKNRKLLIIPIIVLIVIAILTIACKCSCQVDPIETLNPIDVALTEITEQNKTELPQETPEETPDETPVDIIKTGTPEHTPTPGQIQTPVKTPTPTTVPTVVPTTPPGQPTRTPGQPTQIPPTQPPGHSHNWVPVYRTVHHPAETETRCEETVPARNCFKMFYKCNDTGKIWTWDSCTQTQADLDAIMREIEAWIDEQANNGGYGSYTSWPEHYTIPAQEECREVVIKEAWTEEVIDHYKCSCGATKQP